MIDFTCKVYLCVAERSEPCGCANSWWLEEEGQEEQPKEVHPHCEGPNCDGWVYNTLCGRIGAEIDYALEVDYFIELLIDADRLDESEELCEACLEHISTCELLQSIEV